MNQASEKAKKFIKGNKKLLFEKFAEASYLKQNDKPVSIFKDSYFDVHIDSYLKNDYTKERLSKILQRYGKE